MIDNNLLLEHWCAHFQQRNNCPSCCADAANENNLASILQTAEVVQLLLRPNLPTSEEAFSVAKKFREIPQQGTLQYKRIANSLDCLQSELIKALSETLSTTQPSSLSSTQCIGTVISNYLAIANACLVEARAQCSHCKNKHKTAGIIRCLQHEIRTPLQGALLTSELLLEDVQSGESPSVDDIVSIRKAIETAVSILNAFPKDPYH